MPVTTRSQVRAEATNDSTISTELESSISDSASPKLSTTGPTKPTKADSTKNVATRKSVRKPQVPQHTTPPQPSREASHDHRREDYRATIWYKRLHSSGHILQLLDGRDHSAVVEDSSRCRFFTVKSLDEETLAKLQALEEVVLAYFEKDRPSNISVHDYVFEEADLFESGDEEI